MPAQAFTPPAKQKMGTSGRLCITSQAGENMKWLTRDLAKEFLLRCSPPPQHYQVTKLTAAQKFRVTWANYIS